MIHRLLPFASAVRPSRLAAIFMRIQGRPRVMRAKNPTFSSRASSSFSPCSTSIPAARSFEKPVPATFGLGSPIAATTRFTPAAMIASTQGGVRP